MRGSIRRQGEDTWQVRVYNRGAKRYEYFTVKGRLEEARDARSRRLSEIAGGDRPPPRNASRVTVRELADEWLDRKRQTREPKTVQQYEWAVGHVLKSTYGLGAVRVRSLTHADVQAFVDALVAKELSPKSIRGIVSALSQMLKVARRKDIIRFNPAESVEMPTRDARSVVPPTPADILAVINEALKRGEFDRAALIRLKAATGVRRGEIAGLQWEDFDLDGAQPQVTIRRPIPDLRGNGNGPPSREPKMPKTDTGIRTIGLDEETVLRAEGLLDAVP